MRLAWGGLLLLTALPLAPLFSGTQDGELNVNSRYTVETVIVRGDGWTADLAADRTADSPGSGPGSDNESRRLSSGLRKQITSLIGDKLNPAVLDLLATRLRQELQARAVTHRLLRGSEPDFVDVLFEIQFRPTRFDVSVPNFAFTSGEGPSGAIEATATVAQQHAFTVGLVSNADDQVERYSGVVARYEDTHLGSDRVRASFLFAAYQDDWRGSTRTAVAEGSVPQSSISGLYRTRDDIEPAVTFVLARPLTLTLGAGFEHFQDPTLPTVESANALTSALDYHEQFEAAELQQTLDADYDLRMGSHLLGSDYVYLRHHWMLRYVLRHGKHTVTDRLVAGMLIGRAPLYERYVLGNSSTLRGWDKYDIDPLGGNRVVSNSVEYRYAWFEGFYDTGSIWDAGQPVTVRHSLGMGVHQGPVFLAVAFPVRSGRVEPMFMVSMNY
ncbi:MAG TPA: BamA/TamA family outer membrane protein [Bryobacteraceae bacterium]|nr:BamA/TamA family outer membrane protein [Bryobacteraceae bacterium]